MPAARASSLGAAAARSGTVKLPAASRMAHQNADGDTERETEG